MNWLINKLLTITIVMPYGFFLGFYSTFFIKDPKEAMMFCMGQNIKLMRWLGILPPPPTKKLRKLR